MDLGRAPPLLVPCGGWSGWWGLLGRGLALSTGPPSPVPNPSAAQSHALKKLETLLDTKHHQLNGNLSSILGLRFVCAQPELPNLPQLLISFVSFLFSLFPSQINSVLYSLLARDHPYLFCQTPSPPPPNPSRRILPTYVETLPASV